MAQFRYRRNPYKLLIILVGLLILGFTFYLLFDPSLFSRAAGPKQPEVSPTPTLAPGVLLQDEFSGTAGGWPAQEGTVSFGYQAPTFYFLELKEPDRHLVIWRGLSLTRFSIETAMSVNHVDTPRGGLRYGLAVGPSQEQYFAFTIAPRTKTWQVLKIVPSGVEVLHEGNQDSIQGLFELTKLRIDAWPGKFAFYVNDALVVELPRPAATDSSDIGFFLETLDEPLVRVIYDSLTVREIEAEASAGLSATPAPPPSLAVETPAGAGEPPISTPEPPVTPATPVPALPSPTSLEPTATAEPPTPSVTPTMPAALPAPTVTPASAVPPLPTSTPAIPTGVLSLLSPLDLQKPSYGPTEFEWTWTGPVPPGFGFEVRVWRDGEMVAGAHNAVLDNQKGLVEQLSDTRYRLKLDISGAAGVRGVKGEYLWTVALVRVSPDYADLGVQAPPARLRFETPGGDNKADSKP